jgi:pimeloyl-ACP methyl ester carboxylesterase
MLDALSPGRPVDLIGHSMGGNVVMAMPACGPRASASWSTSKASACPTWPRRGPGALTRSGSTSSSRRNAFKPYARRGGSGRSAAQEQPSPVTADKAAWLATHWAEQRSDGQLAPARRPRAQARQSGALSRRGSTRDLAPDHRAGALGRRRRRPACAPSWVDAVSTRGVRRTPGPWCTRCSALRARRTPAHMLHHDQPEALAERLGAFLRA